MNGTVFPRKRWGLRPAYMAGLAVLLAAGLAGFAAYELRESRRLVLESMQRGAASLVEAVARAGENTLRANTEIEDLAADGLLDNARFIRELDVRVGLSDTLLMRLADQNGLFRINVFDASGRREFSNFRRGHGEGHGGRGLEEELGPVLSGRVEERIIGLKAARFEAGSRFAAAVARRGGGAIVVNIDAQQMLAFRKAAGIGRLIQEIGENPGVVYAVLQDREGIVLASRGVEEMARIEGEPFLESALQNRKVAFRLADFRGERVYETVMPFAVDEENTGLFRIGLSAAPLQAEEVRVVWRLGLLGGLVLGLAATGLGLASALTKKAALEADFRRRERLAAMGELASGVAHEVRNPLNAIGMIAQRLEREFEPRSDREEYRGLTKTVRDEVRRVNRIVQQFLEFARPPELALKEAWLQDLVQDALAVMETRARAKGLSVVRRLEDTGTVRVDPEAFQQAMLNLLENAIAATEAGEIRVGCRRVDERLAEVTVADTGSGIAPEHRERIFDLYFTTKAEGTGLGLSMVHRIVSQHGGRIQVESEPGRGSLFRVLLPVQGE